MSDDIKQDLEKILKNLDKIEDIINRPYEPYEYPGDNTPQPGDGTPGPYDFSTTCSKCGMTFEGMTSYYCPQNDCPTFMKAT